MTLTSKQLGDQALLGILMLSKDATAIYSSEDLHISFVNDAMLKIWGKDRSVTGKTFEQAIPEIVGQPFTALLQEVWRSGKTFIATNTPADLIVNGVMTRAWFNFEYRAIQNEAGQTYCLLHTATDVTERLRNEQLIKEKEEEQQSLNEELRSSNEELHDMNRQLTEKENTMQALNQELTQSEARLQNILDTMGEGMAITDLAGNLIYANEKATFILKTGVQLLLQRQINSPEWAHCRLDGTPMPYEEHPLSLAIATGQPVFERELLLQPEGEPPLYLRMNATPITNSANEITGAIGSFSDITERYRLRKELELTLSQLREKEENLRIAIESVNLGTWYLNVNTWEFVPSPRLKELFGYHPNEDMPYEAALNQVEAGHRERVLKAVRAAVTLGESYDMEYPILGYHDGKLRWVRATGKLYSAADGAAAHFSGTMADITERKAEEQRKSDFIGIVSHELRSPLTSLNGYVQMLNLKAGRAGEQGLSDIAVKAKRQLDRMNAIITGFLDMVRMGESKLRLNYKSFNMADLVKANEEESLATVTTHHIVYYPVLYTPVKADQDKIEQVLVNLINNAVKYSPPGSTINVACEIRNDIAYVSVKDEGIGIPAKDQPYIFDRFYRVEGEQTHNVKGFGIGLYISREIIEAHSGQIGVESEPGKGSTFWFTLPIVQGGMI